jgi:hypothetical protein
MRHSSPWAVNLLLFVVGLAAVGGVLLSSANAWEFGPGANVADPPTSTSASSAAAQKRGSSAAQATATNYSLNYSPVRRYFVEFRARNAASYGHMYVMYGEANERHEVVRSEIAGFFPAGDRRDCLNCSVYNWTIGHVLPVPSEIGASDGDLEEQYVLARFRIWIDAAQYKRLVAYINARKANRGPWNAFLNNCVTFGRDVAVFLNVKMPLLAALPPAVVMYPQQLVETIAQANGVYKDQGPLKDAAGSLPVNAKKATAEKAASSQEDGKPEASALH